jgi:uncharacterized phage infection (PIP) family protein YhgE
MGVQQLEQVFSNVRTNLSAWLNMLGLGIKDISAERRMSRRRKYEDECTENLSQHKTFAAEMQTGQM